MTMLINVQSEEAQKRKEFNRKYAKNAVLSDLVQKLRLTAPVIYYETSKSMNASRMTQSELNDDRKVFFKHLE